VTFEAGNQAFGPKSSGAPFQVYAPGKYGPEDEPSLGRTEPPFEVCRRWSFAVASGDRVSYAWKVGAFEFEQYHLRAYGPNGFYREFRGTLQGPALEVGFDSERANKDTGKLTGRGVLNLINREPSKQVKLVVTHHVGSSVASSYSLAPGQGVRLTLDFVSSHRWYDFSVAAGGAGGSSWRYAGRIETGESGLSDPTLGGRRTEEAG
jgi:phospholipase C